MNLQTAMGGLVHMTRVQGAIGACPTLPIVVVMCVCVKRSNHVVFRHGFYGIDVRILISYTTHRL